jgi:hypothetical protein
MHCSMSENSNGGRISFLTSLSIVPSKYGPSDNAIISMSHEFSLFSFVLCPTRKHAHSLDTQNTLFHVGITNKAYGEAKQHPHKHY